MEIQHTNGKVDWMSTLDGVFDDLGVDASKLEAACQLNGANMTITFTNSETGESRAVAMGLPELEEGEDDESIAEYLDEIAQIMTDMVDEFKEIANQLGALLVGGAPEEDLTVDLLVDTTAGVDGTGEPTVAGKEQPKSTSLSSKITSDGVQKVLFSIYDLMALMLEIAQAQRNNARDIRYSELEVQVKSIENQAEHQRKAALYGAIVSGITCVAQIGMMAYAGKKSVDNLQGLNKTAVGQQLTQAQNDIKTVQNSNTLEHAQQNVQRVEGKISNQDVVNDVDQQLSTPEISQAKTEMNAAKTNLNDCKNNLQVNKGQLEQNTKELQAARNEQPPDQTKIGELEARETELKNTIKGYEQQLPGLEQDVNTKTAAYGQKLDAAMAKCEDQYNSKVEDTLSAESKYVDEYTNKPVGSDHNRCKANGETMKAARNEQAKAGQTRTLMKAKVMEMKVEAGISTQGDMDKAQIAKMNAEAATRTDKGYLFASSQANNPMLQQLPTMFSGLFQSFSQIASSSQEAAATEEQATQKEQEQFRDETNSLFNQAQELVKSVLDLCRGVIQAEASSVEQIVRV